MGRGRRRFAAWLAAAAGTAALGSQGVAGAQAGRSGRDEVGSGPIRLGLIEGLSGSFANAGEAVWRNIAFAIGRVNARGGVRLGPVSRPLELLRLDSKGQADEALIMLRRAADLEIGFVLQGNSSTVAAALLEGINRHNERTPGQRMLFLNYSAVDPVLTNERCSFWHFRFDAHVGMRMRALADVLAADTSVSRVYLLNQDYSFGHQVAQLARESIAARRPDIVFAGDEFHPLGRIKDFAPYAAKIKAAGADAVVTGNWGNDLTFLVRAAREHGLDAAFYTFYGNGLGAPAAIAEAGVGRVRAVAEWQPNSEVAAARPDAARPDAARPIYEAFRAGLRDVRDDYFNMRHVVMIEMLVAAIEAAGTTEAAAVARALEGRVHDGAPYRAVMRAGDHQLLTPLEVSVMQRAGPAAGPGAPRFDLEGSGFGFVTERRFELEQTELPHVCRMLRPD
ncbi:MAG: branched-chain amino acid ABC transporter substrate-binding protein [Burkholderiaceae bacterium]